MKIHVSRTVSSWLYFDSYDLFGYLSDMVHVIRQLRSFFEICLRVWTTLRHGCTAIGFQLNTAKIEVLWCATSRR